LTQYACFSHAFLNLCHCTGYKLSALQIRISEENTLNAATQPIITAKISGCILKQGNKTHSSLRQSNLHQQNQAALLSCRMRAIEHRCAAGLKHYQMLKCFYSMLTTAVFELVQQFYDDTEIRNVAKCGQRMH